MADYISYKLKSKLTCLFLKLTTGFAATILVEKRKMKS